MSKPQAVKTETQTADQTAADVVAEIIEMALAFRKSTKRPTLMEIAKMSNHASRLLPLKQEERVEAENGATMLVLQKRGLVAA